jgi:hypothetical protein
MCERSDSNLKAKEGECVDLQREVEGLKAKLAAAQTAELGKAGGGKKRKKVCLGSSNLGSRGLMLI